MSFDDISLYQNTLALYTVYTHTAEHHPFRVHPQMRHTEEFSKNLEMPIQL